MLAPAQLTQILQAVGRGFAIEPGAEISSEANPGAVDASRFQALRRLGVNRLSMGVQSFDENELTFLGRIHTAAEPAQAVKWAREAGFDNLNLDLMFGLPGQRPETWAKTLTQAIDLEPEHLSLYSLIVEPDTPLAAWVARGQVAEPDPDLAADLYEIACERLAAAGYEHYEISNWAQGPVQDDGLPRFACRHNLVYWRNGPYLGFGPGAHSSLAGRRWSVGRSVEDYIDGVQAGAAPLDYEETISPALAMGETMMLGLRLLGVGVSRGDFQARFGIDLAEVYADVLDQLHVQGLIEVSAERARLTQQGWLLGNQAFAAFLPEQDEA